jgi:tetratricopeptide (TPR) repeat protein
VLAALALLGLGALTVRRNQDYRSPVALMQATVAAAPQNDRAHSNLGGVLLDEGRVDEALVELETALRLEPRAGMTHLKLGRAHLARGDLERALPALRQAVDLADLPVCHELLGRALYLSGDVPRAAFHLQRALQGAPENSELNVLVATALERLGRTREARERYETALRSEPGSPDLHLRLASLLLADRQPLTALEHARQANELARAQRADVLELLARAQAAAGDFPSAERSLEAALALPAPAGDAGFGARLRAQLEEYRRRAGH